MRRHHGGRRARVRGTTKIGADLALLAADQPPALAELRLALATIDRHAHAYTEHARLGS